MATQGGLLASMLSGFDYQFVIHRSERGQYFFTYRNVRGNTEPICWSEEYVTKQGCRDAIEKVKSGAATATVIDRA